MSTYTPTMITTREGLMAVPVGTVVRSASGTIACRYDDGRGVVFGDERPIAWSLALPAQVLYPLATVHLNPDDPEQVETVADLLEALDGADYETIARAVLTAQTEAVGRG